MEPFGTAPASQKVTRLGSKRPRFALPASSQVSTSVSGEGQTVCSWSGRHAKRAKPPRAPTVQPKNFQALLPAPSWTYRGGFGLPL